MQEVTFLHTCPPLFVDGERALTYYVSVYSPTQI